MRYETLWRRCGFRGHSIIAVAVFATTEAWIAVYFRYLSRFINSFTDIFCPQFTILRDPFLPNIVLVLVVLLPVTLRQDMVLQECSAYVKIILILVFVGLNIYWLVTDSGGSVKAGKSVSIFDVSVVPAGFREFIVSYTDFILFFPSFNRMRHLTFARLTRCVRWSLFVLFAGSEIVAYMQYFLFYDGRVAEFVDEQVGYDRVTARIALILLFVFVLLTLPPLIEPSRATLLGLVREMDTYPMFVWSSVGLLWLLVALMIAAIGGKVLTDLQIVMVAISGLLQFTLPAIMLAKHMATLHKIHWAGVISYILLGVTMFIYSLYVFFAGI
jgi:hypothetical protein